MRCSNSTCTTCLQVMNWPRCLRFPSVERISTFMHSTATVLLLPRLEVILEIMWVVAVWSCRMRAVVGVVRSSGTVVVCFSDLMMEKKSPNLRLGSVQHVSLRGYNSSTFMHLSSVSWCIVGVSWVITSWAGAPAWFVVRGGSICFWRLCVLMLVVDRRAFVSI